MPLLHFQANWADHRRSALLFFYTGALLSASAIGLIGKIDSFRTLLLVLAVACAGVAIFFLLRFLHANDEREQEINYQALTFAFIGTLIFSVAIGFVQRFGFHPVSWLGIPHLMIVLWSVGLILYSWRYR
jgi:heme/copper-type cytochrome/quinol oxidase subunit 4